MSRAGAATFLRSATASTWRIFKALPSIFVEACVIRTSAERRKRSSCLGKSLARSITALASATEVNCERIRSVNLYLGWNIHIHYIAICAIAQELRKKSRMDYKNNAILKGIAL